MSGDEKDTRYLSGTVLKAAEILKAVSGQGMTASEIGRALGMEKTTVHRLLDTLERVGFVDRSDDRRQYQIGKALAEMCGRPVDFSRIRKAGEGPVRALTKTLRQEVSLSVPYFGQVLYLFASTAVDGTFEFSDRTLAAPMHCTACGKVLLMKRDDADVRRILVRNGMERRTRYTITTPDAFLEELARVRQYGYALGNRELRLRFVRIAVPVFDPDGNVIAALAAEMQGGALYGALSPEAQAALSALREEAKALSAKIGYMA